jgi:HEAT repeat protein
MTHSSDQDLAQALARLLADDVLVQNEGVASLIRIGASSVPTLLPLLKEESPDRRAQVMYALSQIAEPATLAAFENGLLDSDERVRAYAAVGLARIGDPNAPAALARTLNDAPDQLHWDMTPAVYSLGQMGLRALPELLDLLMDDDELTRLRAQRALERINDQLHESQPGHESSGGKPEDPATVRWRTNGNYDYAADVASRAAAVEKWREWIEKQQ